MIVSIKAMSEMSSVVILTKTCFVFKCNFHQLFSWKNFTFTARTIFILLAHTKIIFNIHMLGMPTRTNQLLLLLLMVIMIILMLTLMSKKAATVWPPT